MVVLNAGCLHFEPAPLTKKNKKPPQINSTSNRKQFSKSALPLIQLITHKIVPGPVVPAVLYIYSLFTRHRHITGIIGFIEFRYKIVYMNTLYVCSSCDGPRWSGRSSRSSDLSIASKHWASVHLLSRGALYELKLDGARTKRLRSHIGRN